MYLTVWNLWVFFVIIREYGRIDNNVSTWLDMANLTSQDYVQSDKNIAYMTRQIDIVCQSARCLTVQVRIFSILSSIEINETYLKKISCLATV